MDGDGLSGLQVDIEAGTGAEQTNIIHFNDAHQLTFKYPWDTVPDTTSYYRICPAIKPRFLADIAAQLFPSLPADHAEQAAEGLICALAYGRDASGEAPLSMRVHLFFRNLLGLWVCTNPQCGPNRPAAHALGRLHFTPTPMCQCGSRVLELLYCQSCGETFIGGFRRRSEDNNNEWFLSPDQPNLELAPEMASLDRDHLSYAVYWPAAPDQPGGTPPRPAQTNGRWKLDGVDRFWRHAQLHHQDGRIELGQGTGYLYHVPDMHGNNPPDVESAQRAFPSCCPRCDADWSGTPIGSPVRTQRTGFDKVAQVLADSLLRFIGSGHGAGADSRKLVLFSDSRQDAAKLAAGMSMAHFLDALRQAEHEAMLRQGAGLDAFRRQLAGQALTPEEQQAAQRFQLDHLPDASILMAASNPIMANQQIPNQPGTTYQQAAQAIIARAAQGPFRVAQIATDASARLLSQGTNPGGYSQEMLWTDPERRIGPWRDLYDWPPNGIPAAKNFAQGTPERTHLDRIIRGSREEVVRIIFASRRRDLESLLLAWATADRAALPAPRPLVQQAGDGAIRIFGEYRRINVFNPNGTATLPGYIERYLQAVAARHHEPNPNAFVREVRDNLRDSGTLNHQTHILNITGLCLIRAGDEYYECPNCRRRYLHPAGGICIDADCLRMLNGPFPVQAMHADPDYYGYLATQAGALFRLHCAELTGQTNPRIARQRQRAFQDICVNPEVQLVDAVDLLSVTTTMEAGVDIGLLLAVMMANMPPERFNYQQRVGRAGRRGGVSYCVTLCRGRSHDDYYFQRPARMTEFGFLQPIIVDEAGVIIVGHTRYKAALKLGLTEVWVHVATDLTPEQIKAYRIADNQTATLSDWNYDLLPIELADLRGMDYDLGLLGFDQDDLAQLLDPGVRDGLCDPDDTPAPPDEPTTRPGDLWLLGDHRLLCGDSGKPQDVDRLLDGAAIHLVNTDPPYNVRVEPRSNNAIAAGLSSFAGTTHHRPLDLERHPEKATPTTKKLRPKDRPLENDFVSDEEFERLLHAWFANLARVLLPGRSFYVHGGYSNIGSFPPALKAAGLYFSQAIIWDKQHPVLTRKDFMGAHEWCFYGWREGAAHHFFGPANATDLWVVKKVSPQHMVHLTEKPVELAVRALQYSSRPGENVLDLFAGSGSTLIAAEQTGRKAFLMELDPLYCDVIVQRFEKFTGRKGQRLIT
jgi:DNA modification methylase